jgi:hypothetical protein
MLDSAKQPEQKPPAAFSVADLAYLCDATFKFKGTKRQMSPIFKELHEAMLSSETVSITLTGVIRRTSYDPGQQTSYCTTDGRRYWYDDPEQDELTIEVRGVHQTSQPPANPSPQSP